MDFSNPNDRMRLDNLSKPRDPPRPTIPYAQFPRPSLPILTTNISSHPRESLDAVTSASSRQSYESDMIMDSTSPSGHRRRKSSLMNSPIGNGHRRTRSRKASESTGGDQKWPTRSDEDGRPSPDYSTSGSDEMELGNFSDDDDLNDDEETGLTGQARRQRRRRKRRNTLLDQRIVPDSSITKEEEIEANQSMLKRMAINALLIGLWQVLLYLTLDQMKD
jgi:solute carrier family 35 protein C2